MGDGDNKFPLDYGILEKLFKKVTNQKEGNSL